MHVSLRIICFTWEWIDMLNIIPFNISDVFLLLTKKKEKKKKENNLPVKRSVAIFVQDSAVCCYAAMFYDLNIL